MLAMPMSSPQITRIFGLPPADGAGAAGRGCALSLSDLERRACGERRSCGERRAAEQNLAPIEYGTFGRCFLFDAHDSLPLRTTQRNPRWLVDVSMASAWRAAGRYRRQ